MQLVMVHGASGDRSVWRYQAEYFPGADVVLLPGHPRGRAYNRVEDYTTWLRGYIAGRGYEKPLLVGHSMGGAIGLTYAIRYPEELAGIVIIGSGARLPIPSEVFERIKADFHAYAHWMPSRSMGADAPEELRQAAIQRVLSIDPDTVYGDFEACSYHDVSADIGRISLPALIIGGAADNLIPAGSSQYLHDHVPGSRMLSFEGAGHHVQSERAAQVNAAIAEFAAGLGAAG